MLLNVPETSGGGSGEGGNIFGGLVSKSCFSLLIPALSLYISVSYPLQLPCYRKVKVVKIMYKKLFGITDPVHLCLHRWELPSAFTVQNNMPPLLDSSLLTPLLTPLLVS